jgi:hypothetical protein
MSYYDKYSENCDFLRKRYKLSDNATLYEIVQHLVDELKAPKEINNGRETASNAGNRGNARSQG